ncbi:MAG: hypothetical protein LC664_01695 [Flavobacteriales bacterium]|nr:hypothetical protein [Flavobacteriales bacterium]
MTLIDIKNNEKSVVELYLSKDKTHIKEIKCLTNNRCKEYQYPVIDFLQNSEVSRTLKNKIAIAMAN